jgi:hypothetical protein
VDSKRKAETSGSCNFITGSLISLNQLHPPAIFNNCYKTNQIVLTNFISIKKMTFGMLRKLGFVWGYLRQDIEVLYASVS